MLYPFYDADYADQPTPLYCFNHNGKLRWKHQIGREMRLAGSNIIYAAHYTVMWVGLLHKPTPNGGVIVVGGNRGGTSLFCVELLDKDGHVVSSYYHFGWLWAMGVMDLDGDGYDEVLLGGVNNAYGGLANSTYSMTLVVLDSRKLQGQGPVPPQDGRRLVDLTSGNERAVLFFPEFVDPDPAQPASFCRITNIKPHQDLFEVKAIYNSVPEDKIVEYQFDRQLNLNMVLPSPAVAQILTHKLPYAITAAKRSQEYQKALGNVYVLKNDFAKPGPIREIAARGE